MRVKAFIVLAMLLVIGPAASIPLPEEGEDAARSVAWASLAASHWQRADHASNQPTELSRLDPLVFSPYGSFDPLRASSPVPSLGIDVSQPTLLLIQVDSADANTALKLERSNDLRMLERLSTSVWLARSGDAPAALERLLLEEDVRWAQVQTPGWRMHPSLLISSNRLDLQSVLALDVDEDGRRMLESDLRGFGFGAAECGQTDCRISMGAEDIGLQLARLAVDERILWTEPSTSFVLTNADARDQSGVSAVLTNWNSGLDGSGEVVSVVDTGIDMDHSDFSGRVVAVHNGFGLDSSGSDANSGHGTHVSGTLLGDGSGDGAAMGIAPGAVLHMYQLEHDGLGLMGRIGSIYDMMQDASDTGARIQTTSWVSESSGGMYNSDSRSVDRFIEDNRGFIAIYSAGNNGTAGASTVATPATAKNVLSVGASTDATAANVATFSGQGPTLDGRIKPDLVAPGENICSSRAEESASPAGTDCTGATHGSGTMLHMSLSGASQAAPVAAGAATLTRQFLRQEVGMTAPASDLVRAILINGAEDLGMADIPNSLEGWGRLNLENSLYPTNGGTPLEIWYDDDRSLNPGRMFIYAYDLDPAAGIDITLAWNDPAGSSSSTQSSARLLNDLDLVLVAPDGTPYLGNDFSAGFSTTGGPADSLNNLERIRLAPGQSTQTGVWQVQIHHRAGLSQEYSVVVAAAGQNTPASDLAVLGDSLYISESIPLVNEPVLIRATWVNQADLTTGAYEVRIIDTVTGQELLALHGLSNDMPSLAGGSVGSIQVVHAFSTTGLHDLRLELDAAGSVSELSESNNLYNESLTIAAEGMRLEVIAADGSIDTVREWTFDPFTQTGIDIDLRLYHEGTAEEMVQFSVLSIRAVDEQRPQMTLSTADSWSHSTTLVSNTMSMPAEGEAGAIANFTLSLMDDDASVVDPVRYASAETVIVELVAKYVADPLVVDTFFLTLTILPIADIEVVVAGNGEATALPGAWASFTQSVRNTGNAPAIFELTCTSPSGWEVRVGDSISNVVELQVLEQSQYISTRIRARLPPVEAGQPTLGFVEDLACTVSDTAGTVDDHNTTLSIIVGAQSTFEVIMLDDAGDQMPPSIFDPQISVAPEERVNLTLRVENTGNVELVLTPSIETSDNQWWWELTDAESNSADNLEFSIEPASTLDFRLEVLVFGQAGMGTFNAFQIYVHRTAFDFTLNTTKFILQETPQLSLVEYDAPCTAAAGMADACTIKVKNTGNVPLTLDWPLSVDEGDGFTLPDEWTAYLSETTGYLNVGSQASFKLHLETDASIAVGTQAVIEVIASATLESGTDYSAVISVDAVVRASSVIVSTVIDSAGSELDPEVLQGLDAGSEVDFIISISNHGNTGANVEYRGDDSDIWVVDCTPRSVSLDPGETQQMDCVLSAPLDGAGITDISLDLNVSSSDASVEVESNAIVLRTSSPTTPSKAVGLLGMSTPVGAGVLLLALLAVLLVGMRLRRSAFSSDEGEDIIAAGQLHEGDSSSRMSTALDVGGAQNDLVSGGVSSAEIAEALAKSKPALPKIELPGAPPLPAVPATPVVSAETSERPALAPGSTLFGFPPIPPEGIPTGWTTEQWLHYGHQWLKDQRK